MVRQFSHVALRTLKDLEHQVMLEAEALGLQRGISTVGPEAVLGIELNPYAAELARLTVWIGEIQWMLGPRLQPERPADSETVEYHRMPGCVVDDE